LVPPPHRQSVEAEEEICHPLATLIYLFSVSAV